MEKVLGDQDQNYIGIFIMAYKNKYSGTILRENNTFETSNDRDNSSICSMDHNEERLRDNIDENILKKQIYQTLIKIVGSEEDIKLRQRAFEIMDIVNGFGDDDSISVSSGSLPEGLDMKGSDEDMMLLLKYVDVIPSMTKVEPSEGVTNLYMEMGQTRPGYAKLFALDSDINNMYISKSLTNFEDRKLVSSEKFRGLFVRPGMDSHGPCVSDGVFDFAISLPGANWPEIAKERLMNCKSKTWLPDALKEDLLSRGCVYVPVGPRNSADYDKLWRISFALSERQLLLRMTYPQMLCYALLKLVLKEIINKNDSTKELLCSYFMKTCLFWVIEETDNSENTWNTANLFTCFNLCINKIAGWVNACNCPNYFLPQNNMFTGRIHDENKSSLLDILSSIKEEGYTTLVACDSFNQLWSSTEVSEIEREAKLDILFYRVMHIYPFDSMDLLRCALETINKLYKSETHSFTKGVIKRFQASTHQELAQMMKISDNEKEAANVRRQQKVHLLNACSGDACCGFILLASFYHVQGRHYTALEIINTTLQKLTPAVLQSRQAEYTDEEKERYMDSICGRGLTLEEKMKVAMINNIVLLDDSSVVPKEFQPEVNHCRPLYVMPPVAYAYSIQFLCYHHLNDSENKIKAIRRLEKVVLGKYFVLDRHFSNALTLLGACYETIGDLINAKRCYLLALDNPPNCQSVLFRLKRLDENMVASPDA